MKNYINKHPLFFVILIAILIRLPAVIWSQGYIHSDDHFDTIEVARDWAQDGLWGEDGYLRWKNQSSESIARFPLYTLFLYGILLLYKFIGITSLNTIMFGVRSIHALISIIPIWAGFKIILMTTNSKKWAIIGGLVIASNFAMPFLGVRNLIEMVGGNIWVLALYFLYKYKYEYDKGRAGSLFMAGIITGLAWMIRFQIAFAVLPIPIILWLRHRELRPAIEYSTGVVVMLMLSGIIDWFFLGSFAASTIRNLSMNTTLGALYKTVPLMYPLELLVFLVPPISFLAIYYSLKPSFWKKHQLLFFSILMFFVFHMSHSNQQERFIFPIIPAALIMAILACWEKYRKDGYILKKKKLWNGLIISSLAVNLIILIPLTVSSGHLGLVKAMVWIENLESKKTIVIIQPHLKQWMPLEYTGDANLDRATVRDWNDLQNCRNAPEKWDKWKYCIFYPMKDSDMNEYLDSAIAVFGQMEYYDTIEPSFYDNILHKMNPRYNPSFKAIIYKRTGI